MASNFPTFYFTINTHMNTQNIIGYKKGNKIDIIQFIVPVIIIFITIFISNILRQNRVDNITYQHKQQIKYIKY